MLIHPELLFRKDSMARAITILTITMLSLIGCKGTTNDPDMKSVTREYIWTIDTLAYPGSIQTTMMSIWGSSINNIYVVGHNDRVSGSIYHYDGEQWSPVSIPTGFSYSLSKVLAISSKKFLVVGSKSEFVNGSIQDSALIYEWNGSAWNKRLEGGSSALFAVGGDSESWWAGGYGNTIYSGNDLGIKKDSIPSPIGYGSMDVRILSIAKTKLGEPVVLVNFNYPGHANNPDDRFIFKKDPENGWVVHAKLFSGTPKIIQSNEKGEIICFGQPSFIMAEGKNMTIPDIDTVRVINGDVVSSRKMVVGGYFNKNSVTPHMTICTWDGETWRSISDFYGNTNNIIDVKYVENDLIVLCNTKTFPQKTIVYHGRFK